MSRNILFTAAAWESYTWWQTQDRKTLRRINALIGSATRTPFEGIGKPEPLAGNLAGFWARRIDDANRLVYAVNDADVTVLTCRFHYDD